MKRIISLSLAALLLVTLLLTATSCGMGMESMTGYTRLRDHLVSQNVYDGKVVPLNTHDDTYIVALCAVKDENDGFVLRVMAHEMSDQASDGTDTSPAEEARLTMTLNGNTEKASIQYEAQNGAVKAESTLYFIHYTGDDLITFENVSGLSTPDEERHHRESATDLCNVLLKALDSYTGSELDMSVSELGFIALSDNYKATKNTIEAEKDLGGAFSLERLKMAALMLLQGVGMVFLVLAVLWAVLAIFKNIFAKDSVKAERAQKAADKAAKKAAKKSVKHAEGNEEENNPMPVAPPAAATTDDGQLIAVITAAVAAAIESDEDLSNQFAGGFRVVSFKKKNGKTSWTH